MADYVTENLPLAPIREPSDETWEKHVRKVAAAMRRRERRGKCGLCGTRLVDGKCPVDEERLAAKVVDLDVERRKRRASR